MTLFEKKNRKKFSRIKLLNDLKKEYEISDEDISRKKMFQYSKVITTIILITTSNREKQRKALFTMCFFMSLRPKDANISV